MNLIRKYFPKAGITTDVIVGFPTETEEDFEKSKAFIEKMQFSDIHVFPYSKRDGTVAAKLYKDLPKNIKTERVDMLENLRKKLKENFVKKNDVLSVLLEEEKEGYYTGYSENYIKCYIQGRFKVGDIVRVKIKKSFKDGVLVEKL